MRELYHPHPNPLPSRERGLPWSYAESEVETRDLHSSLSSYVLTSRRMICYRKYGEVINEASSGPQPSVCGAEEMNQAVTRRTVLLICLLLVLACLAIYLQVFRFEFVNLDDEDYVTGNYQVRSGLTASSVLWAFTSTAASNWHPLTWLSHIMDYQLYGLNPAGHHLSSLLIHILNTLILFLLLSRMTGSLWRSAFVAALFAVHPMHVESVAWVSERKDVLSTLFGLLTIWAYVRYVDRPGLKRYALAALVYAIGLMAKPMLVSLPLILLALDYWPLGRFATAENGASKRKTAASLLREKVPLFVLVLASSVVTFVAQQKGGAVSTFTAHPLGVRAANAVVAYVEYMYKMLWPSRLAAYYPHPGSSIPTAEVVFAGVLLIGMTAAVVLMARRHPYLAVGWFWYVVMLIPVIGLVQVGGQAMADRYTYMSFVGLFIIVAWSVPDLATRFWPGRPACALSLLAVGVIAAFTVVAWLQTGHWRNTVTLFENTLANTSDNYVAHSALAVGLAKQGKADRAIEHCRQALDISPRYAEAHTNLATFLLNKGEVNEAIYHYREALRSNPQLAYVHYNLGNALALQRNRADAVSEYREALRIDPDFPLAHVNLANELTSQGKTDEAITHLEHAIRVDPSLAPAHYNLARALASQKRYDEAMVQFEQALKLDPKLADAHNSLGILLAQEGRNDEAISHYAQALRLKPKHSEAHNNMGLALASQGKMDEAIHEFQTAIRLNPRLAPAYNSLGKAEFVQGRLREAMSHYAAALRIQPNLADAHANMGIALAASGKLDQAIPELLLAVKIAPDNAEAHKNLAIAFFYKKDYAKAWHEVGLCKKYGGTPKPEFLRDLSAKMPEPSKP